MTKYDFLESVSYMTDANGQRTAVVVDIGIWNTLLEQLDTDRSVIKQTPMRGATPAETLQFIGLIEKDDLALMSEAIEAGCEQVDLDEW